MWLYLASLLLFEITGSSYELSPVVDFPQEKISEYGTHQTIEMQNPIRPIVCLFGGGWFYGRAHLWHQNLVKLVVVEGINSILYLQVQCGCDHLHLLILIRDVVPLHCFLQGFEFVVVEHHPGGLDQFKVVLFEHLLDTYSPFFLFVSTSQYFVHCQLVSHNQCQ